ncbi:MAG: hypothetical protein KDJ41_20860 [Hyphomicrobiaceae bacterium]|nr:hypothetical protein [Hyphomicrobiaceae bacterium]
MLRRTFLAALAVLAAATLLPELASAQRGQGRWEMLGAQKVGFAVDRDVIRVGRREGRFRAVQLRVRGNDIHMMDLKVVFGNGEVQDIPVRRMIKAPGETRVIDLRGDRRIIREVQMVYRSRPSFRGQATVEVWGRH